MTTTTEKKPIFTFSREKNDEYKVETLSVAEMASRYASVEDAFQYGVARLLFNAEVARVGGYTYGMYTSKLTGAVAEQTARWLAETVLLAQGDDDNLRKPVIRVVADIEKYRVERMSVSDVFAAYPDAGEQLEGVLNHRLSEDSDGGRSILLTNDPETLQAQFVILAPMLSAQKVAA